MQEFLGLLRASQLFAHSSHLLCDGSSFFSDHGFFKETYEQLEDDYDAVAERVIGVVGEDLLHLQEILLISSHILADAPSFHVTDNKVFFQFQLKLEEKICSEIQEVLKTGLSAGVEQLLGDIANESESRQYKIKRRLE